jgi:hypothetical protein
LVNGSPYEITQAFAFLTNKSCATLLSAAKKGGTICHVLSAKDMNKVEWGVSIQFYSLYL